ncbi:MAG: glutamate 5-kinase [Candidatus Melainabacteria bacterium]|nr:glutamate 5-kinase [Candidatus Melainabacteria bacterium]
MNQFLGSMPVVCRSIPFLVLSPTNPPESETGSDPISESISTANAAGKIFPLLKGARRVVVKLGTQLLVRPDGELAIARLASLVEQCADLKKQGREVIIVTSGAVGLGLQALGLHPAALTLTDKQACAAVGQSLLMNTYRELFRHYGLSTAQILLTAANFADRHHYVSLQKTMARLLELNVVPIVNENDAVSTVELAEDTVTRSFGDNDKLSALVAGKLSADVLVILTNVEGIYTDNPFKNPQAEKISQIDSLEQLNQIRMDGQSQLGRGGMSSKIEAVRVAAICGVHTVVASGLTPDVLRQIFDSKASESMPGTLVVGHAEGLSGRKRWIGLASGYSGVVMVNDGAKRALQETAASLLPVGVVQVHGDFRPRQVVSIQDVDGHELGRGVVNFSADEVRRVMGHGSQSLAERLGYPVEHDVIVRRDNLVIYEERPPQ